MMPCQSVWSLCLQFAPLVLSCNSSAHEVSPPTRVHEESGAIFTFEYQRACRNGTSLESGDTAQFKLLADVTKASMFSNISWEADSGPMLPINDVKSSENATFQVEHILSWRICSFCAQKLGHSVSACASYQYKVQVVDIAFELGKLRLHSDQGGGAGHVKSDISHSSMANLVTTPR